MNTQLNQDRHRVSPYPLRIPGDVRGRLEEAALKSRRSLNNEILTRLERSLKQEATEVAQ